MNGHDRDEQDMNRHEWLNDDAIEAVFARRAGRAESGELRDRVFAATAGRQRFGPWAAIRVGLHLGVADDRSVRRVVVLAFAVVVLVALLVVSALVGARLSNPRPGERLAFVRDGDIYLANSDGSAALRLLHDDGTQFSDPVWSPDGRRLAVDASGGAILVDVGSGAIQRIGGSSPAWSPDGRRIALIDQAVENLGTAIRILDAQTGSTIHLYPVSGIGPLVWSPNGRWIALAGVVSALLRVDAGTGEVVQLDSSFALLDSPRDPSWSPDSVQIAFVRYNGCSGGPGPCTTHVFVADADGSHVAQLPTSSGSFDRPTWSPDGRWMAFRTKVVASFPSTVVSDELVVTRPDGTQERVLTSANVDSYIWNATSDGLLFSASAGSGQRSELWQVSLDGVAHPLAVSVDPSRFGTTNGFARQAPTADGPLSALPSTLSATPAPTLAIGTPSPASPVDASAVWPVLASDAGDGCEPGVVDTRHGTVAVVASLCDQGALSVSSAAWSPDGSTYAAAVIDSAAVTGSAPVTDSVGVGSLTLVRADGTVTSKVADLRGISSVAWSSDGRWLTASGDQTGYLLRPDGTLVRELPGMPSWTPDGRRLVVARPDGVLLVGGPDGSDLQPIGTLPMPEAWAPDGARFAYGRDGDIWTAAADGTDVRNITAFRLGGANGVAWSPDGQWIAVAPGRGLWLMRPDGTDRQFIDLGLAVGIAGLVWSPDGHQLAVETYDNGGTALPARVLLLTADGSQAIAIESAGAPVWSPDGRFLAVVSSDGDYEVMNADGTGRAPLPGVRPGIASFAWIR